MRKPARLIVLAVTVPFLGGCFAVLPSPLPDAPAEREALDIRGVVLADSGDGERVEFRDVLSVQWTDDDIQIVGWLVSDNGAEVVTRTFPFSSLSGVLVRQLDAGPTSGIIGVVIVGAVAIVMVAVNGRVCETVGCD